LDIAGAINIGLKYQNTPLLQTSNHQSFYMTLRGSDINKFGNEASQVRLLQVSTGKSQPIAQAQTFIFHNCFESTVGSNVEKKSTYSS
jgi:uncharacterized protein YigA (DUF484 family)